MELFAALFAALAVFVAIAYATRPRRMSTTLEERFEKLERGTEMRRDDLMALPFTVRVGTPMGRAMKSIGAATLPAGIAEGVRKRLMLAGWPMTMTRFVVFQCLMFAVSALIIVAVLVSDTSGLLLLGQIVGGAALSALPIYWLRIKGAARRRTILRSLPDAVDLMVTTVEAGMGIDGALSAVGNETAGPLGDELRLAVRENTLGRSRRESLLRLVERTQVRELTSFIQALIQAEQTGIPIGQVLRIQAEEMRLHRRQQAEAAAQRAPVKMILVLILFILPAMMMFVMGPAFMRMRDAI